MMRAVVRVFILFVVLSWGGPLAWAQKKSGANSSNLFETKVKLEELISQRLRSTIATTLDKDSFDVSVQVFLVEAPRPKSKPKAVTEISSPKKQPRGTELPLDLTVGLIDADAVIQKYEEELQELKIRQSIMVQKMAQTQEVTPEPPEFLVRSMNVYVGLQEQFGTAYASELEKWLKETLSKEFGNTAMARVSLIKPKPEKVLPPKSILEQLQDFQSLIGYILFAWTAIIGILLFKFLGSKDALENRKLNAQLQQDLKIKRDPVEALPEASAPSTEALEESPPRDENAWLAEQVKEIRGKIAWSASSNLHQLSQVFEGWLESGERGFYKTAALTDVLIGLKGDTLDWQKAIPETHRKRMREIFDKMAKLEVADYLDVLEGVYWDLVSLKTLGSNYLIQPFQFMGSLPAQDMRTLISTQNPQMKTLIVLHMPEDARNEYFSKLPLEGKREIVEQSLQMEKVLVTDIETASETLKYEVKKINKSGHSVSIKSMAPKLLESISVVEEIILLVDIAQRISDRGLSIKQSFPTLAFIDEWPADAAKLVLGPASSDEILALLRLMPHKKDRILSFCAPRVQAIVGEDLLRDDFMSLEEKHRHLSSLKLRMLQLLNKKSLSMEDIFGTVGSGFGGLRVAS